MDGIYLRTATQDDLPVLLSFEQGIIDVERPYDETLKPGLISYYDIKAMIDSEETEVVVAAFGAEIVGSAYVSIRTAQDYLIHSHYGYLGFMYIKSEYRGKGINNLIIEELKLWARSKNINELRLDVYDENHSAIKAYDKAGFKKQLVNMRMAID